MDNGFLGDYFFNVAKKLAKMLKKLHLRSLEGMSQESEGVFAAQKIKNQAAVMGWRGVRRMGGGEEKEGTLLVSEDYLSFVGDEGGEERGVVVDAWEEGGVVVELGEVGEVGVDGAWLVVVGGGERLEVCLKEMQIAQVCCLLLLDRLLHCLLDCFF